MILEELLDSDDDDDDDDVDDDDVDSRSHGRGHGHGRHVGLFTIKNVFAEYDDEKGLVFYPPVYAQRYAVVIDCLLDQRWYEKLEKVVDFGYHDLSFIRYLKDVSGINHILGVDIETIPARCSYDLLEFDNNAPKKESPVCITLLQGNAADPDYRLIGCDAVLAIELIEHMLPHDLERFVHTVFGFIKPWIAVITTPNSDFNVLFKALEKNGLRRLDHYFEWSREQFHDWCSNIVTRYPQYTVTSKGIGPGPPGTWHLGSCSQLALFVSKDYQKQPDLCLNSLTLLPKPPSKRDMFEDNWIRPTRTFSDPTLCKKDNGESYTKLLIDQQSFMTAVITSPTFSLENLRYQDKILQCNIESELGKNFLMFDDEMYFNVLIPRRKKMYNEYEIEDVASRLNCTKMREPKIFKGTLGLMAKNTIDQIIRARKVIQEIKRMVQILDLNTDRSKETSQGNHIWYNINWGENAPYWNQYYKVFKEYVYPSDINTEESRILDAIVDEINSFIDREYGELPTVTQKFEIPLDQILKSVEEITNDVDKVKEILEWNGYDIEGDFVIYTHVVDDDTSSDKQEEDSYQETPPDWDTSDVRFNSMSDGSTTVLDSNDRRLRRALDQKVRKLRTLFTADEDIKTELNRILCRLMKLALYSKKRPDPPSASWMQWKLFDLLTLTEKAIERRRRHYIQNYPIKAIEYYNENNIEKNVINTFKAQDFLFEDIVSKYYDVAEPPDFKDNEDFQGVLADFEYDNTISLTSNDIEEFGISDNSIHDITEIVNNKSMCPLENSIEFNMVKLPTVDDASRDSVESNILEKISCPYSVNNNDLTEQCESNDNLLNSGEYVNNDVRKAHDVSDINNEKTNSMLSVCNVKDTVLELMHDTKQKNVNKTRSTKTKTLKKVSSKITNGRHKIKRRKIKDHQKLQSTLSTPIPDSLIKLCGPKQDVKNLEEFSHNPSLDSYDNINQLINIERDIAATEDSFFIGIVTEYGEESIALRRNVGIDPPIDFEIIDTEDLETIINITKAEDFLCKETVDRDSTSQTIFIYDINEPSTSKGIQNLSTDAQCGPDVSLTCATISATTSLSVMPNILCNGVKIEDSHTQINKKTSEFGTCTESMERPIAVGIKIKDSEIDISNKINCSKMIEITKELPLMSNYLKESSETDTKLLKPASSAVRTEDSGSENCITIFSLQKPPSRLTTPPKNCSNMQIQAISKENILTEGSQINCVKQNLICGGVHIHSFKERQVSEDVVYQGEWQRIRFMNRTNPQDEVVKRNSLQNKKNRNSIKHRNVINDFNISRVNQPKRLSIKPKLKKIKSNESNKNNIKKHNNIKNNIKIKNAVQINKNAGKTMSTAMSSLKSKNTKTYPHKNLVIDLNSIPQNKDKMKNCKNINYIPMYLRRRNRRSNADSNSKIKFDPRVAGFDKDKTALFYSIKDEITKELLKFVENIKVQNNYIVCRNENEIKNSSSKNPLSGSERVINNNINLNRNHSPPSRHSSTCSSPNSVVTVRAVIARSKTISPRRRSLTSELNNSGFEAENKSMKTKNFSKLYKSSKNSPNKICSNKENIPQTSKNIILCKKEKASNSAFVGKTKSVFMAQATGNSTLQLTSGTVMKNDLKKLNTKHDNPKDKQGRCLPNASKSDTMLKPNYNDFKDNDSKNNTNVLQSIKYEQLSNSNTEQNSESFDSPNKSVHSTESSIMSAIRQLIEQKIPINETYSHDSIDSGSETIILNRDDTLNSSFNSSSSPLSISTVIANEDNIPDNDITSALVDLAKTDQNDSLLSCTDVKPSTKEIDALSFKSSDLSSVSTSRFSEYYLADNELDNTLLNISSVQDIFERSDRVITNVDGLLAAQAFSGFSINTGSFVGDREDNVNLIDSETGSITFGSARQAVSEELFVSGRSSDTYESCLVEDDVYVPNWLFNAISQQPSIEESEAEDDFLPMPIPLEEPVFDVNGNVMEPGVGVGAGAGDGRGMHSDQSQDSSGRGTSLSSSATSSGQSEAILIDLSTNNQPHHVHEPINIPEEDDEINEAPFSSEGDTINDAERARNTNCLQLTSDDADVSSLDTDAIDSDD